MSDLSLHIEALENMLDEKKGISDNIKDRFALAKGDGFDPVIMKRVIARRAMERAAREEHDTLVATYEAELEFDGE